MYTLKFLNIAIHVSNQSVCYFLRILLIAVSMQQWNFEIEHFILKLLFVSLYSQNYTEC